MIDKLVEKDKEFFLFLNGKNQDLLDPIMLVLSSYELWWTVFIIFAICLWYFAPKRAKLAPVSFYAGSVLFSTLFTNGLKLIIQRPRPIHETEWFGIIHNIESHSSAFSFFSSHAATTCCIAVFVFLFFKDKRYLGIIAILWALGVSYSRIYVGKHYPLDVFVGIIFGSLVGYMGYRLYQYFLKKKGFTD